METEVTSPAYIKVRLPRKRKKQYIKDNTRLVYMSSCIINEMCVNGEFEGYNKAINRFKFCKKVENYPNGFLKKVISYY